MITMERDTTFRFPQESREKVLALLGGDESKLIILEDELSPEQAFIRNTTEIGPYGCSLREGRDRRQTADDITEEREENKMVLAKLEKLKKTMQEMQEAVKEWSWYGKITDHRAQNPESGPNPLDINLFRLEHDIAFLEEILHHYSGKEKDLRKQEEKRHILAVVLSLFPGRINVEGYRKINKHPIKTDPYRLAEIVMRELDIEPGDFRRLYTTAAKRLNKIRNL